MLFSLVVLALDKVVARCTGVRNGSVDVLHVSMG